MFTKKEFLALIISVLILTFIFGFYDGSPTFVLSNWMLNFFRIFLLVSVAVLFRELVIKLFAKRHDATSEYEIWNIKQIWFNVKLKMGLPLGILIALIFAIVSKGRFFFTAIGTNKLKEIGVARVGRKYQNIKKKDAKVC